MSGAELHEEQTWPIAEEIQGLLDTKYAQKCNRDTMRNFSQMHTTSTSSGKSRNAQTRTDRTLQELQAGR